MSFMWLGQDEIRFPEYLREVAQEVADALPQVKRKSKELLGLEPPSVRILLSADRPRARDYLRLSRRAVVELILLELIFVGLILAGLIPEAVGFLCATVASRFAPVLYQGLMGMRRAWPRVGGLASGYHPLLAPVVALRAAEASSPPTEVLQAHLGSRPAVVAAVIAHEYAHVVLYEHYRPVGLLPAWADEGLASWFSEQVVEKPMWLPESRACLSEPEPESDPRHNHAAPLPLRLWARYYWEVRMLVEGGLLPELLTASAEQLDSLRPTLHAPDQCVPRT